MTEAFISQGDIFVKGSILHKINDGIDINAFNMIPSDVKFSEVSATEKRIAALDLDGEVWLFEGVYVEEIDNKYNDFYEDSQYDFQDPTETAAYDIYRRFQNVSEGMKFKKVSCTDLCIFALDEEGNLWMKGFIFGSTYSSENFRKIESDTTYKEISCDGTSGALIDTEGHSWVFGAVVFSTYNTENDKYLSPVRVPITNRFKSISYTERILAGIDYEDNLFVYPVNTLLGGGEGPETAEFISAGIIRVSCYKNIMVTIDINGSVIFMEFGHDDRITYNRRIAFDLPANEISIRNDESLLILDNEDQIHQYDYIKNIITTVEGIIGDKLSDQSYHKIVGKKTKSARKI